MNLPWFKRIGIFFIPRSIIGWTLFLAGIAYSVYMFIDIDSRSHSVSDTIRPFFLDFLFILVVYSIIGYFTSGTPEK